MVEILAILMACLDLPMLITNYTTNPVRIEILLVVV
jgi:hypothetical protein